MIHAHLKAYAKRIDEKNYQVELRDNIGFGANKAFEDGDGLEGEWMRGVWSNVFRNKLAGADITFGPSDSVLDACCGQGFLGQYLLKLGAAVTFTDLSGAQLASLATRLPPADTRASFTRADLLRLPFADRTFDKVVGNSFLHHLPDVPAALQEMRRILKPGGSLILLHEPSIRANWWETFPLSLVKDTTYNSGFTDLWQFDPNDLADVLENAGFESVKIKGSGVLAAVLCNWFLILASKMGITHRLVVGPALRLRAALARLELRMIPSSSAGRFPSLLILAVSPGAT
jgi:SAM-dependent methyltransferase